MFIFYDHLFFRNYLILFNNNLPTVKKILSKIEEPTMEKIYMHKGIRAN